MRVVVERNRGVGTDICEIIADTYFKVDNEGMLYLLREDVQPMDDAQLEEAMLLARPRGRHWDWLTLPATRASAMRVPAQGFAVEEDELRERTSLCCRPCSGPRWIVSRRSWC